uniref:Ribosomal protein S1 n=2 Tax=Psilotum nudum TaxID=3240 RepID=A0A1B3TRM7_PSINU|nr:ribosomal protein S1 [Psilotum nudum]
MSFSQLLPTHNSSFLPLRESALQYSVKPLQSENKGPIKLLHPHNMVPVNTGLKTPVILSRDEVTARVPITEQAGARGNGAGGNYGRVSLMGDTLKTRIPKSCPSPLPRFDFVGIQDSFEVEELREPRIIRPKSEPKILLPEPLNKKRVWIEPTKIWRDRGRRRVKGFLSNSIRGGYAVAIAGFIALSPRLRIKSQSKGRDRRFGRNRRWIRLKIPNFPSEGEWDTLPTFRNRNIVVGATRDALAERGKHHRKVSNQQPFPSPRHINKHYQEQPFNQPPRF